MTRIHALLFTGLAATFAGTTAIAAPRPVSWHVEGGYSATLGKTSD